MNTVQAIALSSGCASAVCTAAFLTLSPGPSSPLPAGNGPDAGVERRLDRLERDLRDLGSRTARGSLASTDGSAAMPQRAPVVDPGSGASAARLNDVVVRLDDLERKLEVLTEDPLLRARNYLESTNPRARREGVELLARFARFDPEARQKIRAMLNDPDAGVRREAVQAIGRSRDREALPAVSAMLADQNSRVRTEAADAMEDLLEGLEPGSPQFQQGVDALLARVGDSEGRVREEIIDTIGDLGAKQATPTLIRMLGDADGDVREEAVEALGTFGDRSAIPHLQRLYQNTPAGDRMDIAVAMARLGDTGAFRQEASGLVRALQDRSVSNRERARAVSLLGRADPSHYRGVQEQARQDPRRWVRRAAEPALRRLR